MAMMVGDIMVKAKAVIFESDSLDEAARTFVEYGLDGMVVCRCSEEIVGVVAVKDVLFGLVQGKTTVREVMRPSLPPLSIHDRVEVIEFGGVRSGPLSMRADALSVC